MKPIVTLFAFFIIGCGHQGGSSTASAAAADPSLTTPQTGVITTHPPAATEGSYQKLYGNVTYYSGGWMETMNPPAVCASYDLASTFIADAAGTPSIPGANVILHYFSSPQSYCNLNGDYLELPDYHTLAVVEFSDQCRVLYVFTPPPPSINGTLL